MVALAAACAPAPPPQDKDAVAKSASAAIEASCGRPIPVTVDWASFEGGSAGAAEAIKASRLEFLTAAITDICLDAEAGPALAAQADAIVLRQAAGASDGLVYIYERKLIIEYAWAADGAPPSTSFIVEEIKSRLRGEAPEAP